jgi:hypothetical protein
MTREEKAQKEFAIKEQKERIEQMRSTVIEDELRARYWKAKWETKYYQLEDSKISPEYEQFLQEEQAKLEKMQAEREELIKKLSDAGVGITEAPKEEEAV